MDRRLIPFALAATMGLIVVGHTHGEYVNFSYQYHPSGYPAEDSGRTISVSIRIGPVQSRSGIAETGAVPLTLAPLHLITEGIPPAAPLPPGEVNQRAAFFIHLTDLASGENAYLFFSGEMTGKVGRDTSSMVQTYSPSGSGTSAQAELGGRIYRLSVPDVAVAPWSVGRSADFSPRLTVSMEGVEHAPEPSTFALGAAAALGLAARRWLRRRA